MDGRLLLLHTKNKVPKRRRDEEEKERRNVTLRFYVEITVTKVTGDNRGAGAVCCAAVRCECETR